MCSVRSVCQGEQYSKLGTGGRIALKHTSEISSVEQRYDKVYISVKKCTYLKMLLHNCTVLYTLGVVQDVYTV